MKFILSIVVGLTMASTWAVAQSPVIRGYIRDDRGEALPGSSVTTPEGRMARSNAYGFFSLAVGSVDSIRLSVSSAGYQPTRMTLPGTPPFGLLHLVLMPVELATVEIQAKPSGASFSALSPLGAKQFSMQQLARIPAVGGEVDPLKSLALTPGVSQGIEGSSGILVRGGTPDQNLILLDGSPVYNVAHGFGFLSVFNADAIQSVNLLTGGFPARYGGRLSSVIDIYTREGSQTGWHGKVGLGLVSSKLFLEGPVIRDKSSFFVSGRASNIGLVLLPSRINYNRNTVGGANYTYFHFWDVNAKYNHSLNDKHKIFASFYSGGDTYDFRERSGLDDNRAFSKLQWGNTTASVRHTWLASDRIFIKNSLGWSKFYNAFNQESNTGTLITQALGSRSAIEDISIRSEAEGTLGSRHVVKAGVEGVYHLFLPRDIAVRTNDSIPPVQNQSDFVPAREISVYAEDEFQVHAHWMIGYGVRYNLFHVKGETYHSFQPRLQARYSWHPDWAIKLGYGRMQQNLHLIANNGIGLPTDIWVPATDWISPQYADQVTFAVVREFARWQVNTSFEAYYKRMYNQIDVSEGISFVAEIDKDWQDLVESGGFGRAYGFEWFVQKSSGRFTGMLGYTLAWSERQFANINEGLWYANRYDRRHDVEVSAAYRFNCKWAFSANWVYQTGAAITLPVGRYQGTPYDPDFTYIYTARNAARLPAYHRADVALTRTKPTRRWKGERILGFQIYNFYNRRNPYYLQIGSKQTIGANGEIILQPVLKQRWLLPILPSVNWSISW